LPFDPSCANVDEENMFTEISNGELVATSSANGSDTVVGISNGSTIAGA
jgi:hypothetical protein